MNTAYKGAKHPAFNSHPDPKVLSPCFCLTRPFHTDIHNNDSHWTSRITETLTDWSRLSLHVKVTPLSVSVAGEMQMLLMFTLFPSFRSTWPSPRYQSSSSALLLFCTRQEREMGVPDDVDRVKSAAWLFTDSSTPAEGE